METETKDDKVRVEAVKREEETMEMTMRISDFSIIL